MISSGINMFIIRQKLTQSLCFYVTTWRYVQRGLSELLTFLWLSGSHRKILNCENWEGIAQSCMVRFRDTSWIRLATVSQYEYQNKTRAEDWGLVFESQSRQTIFLKINMNDMIQGFNLTWCCDGLWQCQKKYLPTALTRRQSSSQDVFSQHYFYLPKFIWRNMIEIRTWLKVVY